MLIKKDLEKKRQALNDEKNLINERLNARKAAIDEEDKYEELAELQKQLALIAADPTRSKDAKELRRQISDLQKDIAWDIASDQAQSATDAIDDQIAAIDDYVSNYEEDLNEMLEDSRNFEEEIDQLTSGTFDEYVEWMKENNENYANATDEAREQMINGWEDTWKKMQGTTDTYWDEVAEIASSEESFMEYMKESQTYQNASETGKASLEYFWNDMYDNYLDSIKNDAELGYDQHEIVDTIKELQDYTYSVELTPDFVSKYGEYMSPHIRDYKEESGYGLEDMDLLREQVRQLAELYNQDVEMFGNDSDAAKSSLEALKYFSKILEYYEANGTTLYTDLDYQRDKTVSQEALDYTGLDQYAGVSGSDKEYKNKSVGETTKIPTYIASSSSSSDDGSSGSGGSGGGTKTGNTKTTGTKTEDEEKKADEKVKYYYNSLLPKTLFSQPGYAANYAAEMKANAQKAGDTESVENWTNNNKVLSLELSSLTGYTFKYEQGGLVDYTGPAWVDGTKSNPEAFLSAADTKNIRALLDAFNYIDIPTFTVPSTDMFNDYNTNSIGDINITVNTGAINNELDINRLAKQIGESFTKTLSKNGFNTAYAF